MLGMGAMMGAVLQAPLAALIAVVELTGTPNITLPAMLAIVVAVVTTNSLFRQRSVFLATLEARGLSYLADPVAQYLQRTGVVSVMDRSFVVSLERITRDYAITTLDREPRWIVVDGPQGPLYVIAASNLQRYLNDDQQERGGESIRLDEISGATMDIALIDSRATMYEAWQVLKNSKVDALCVRRADASTVAITLGILTREDVLRFARVND